MFAFGGDAYTADIIQKAHNERCDLHLDASAGGSSTSKAEFLQGNGYGFDTIDEMISQSSYLSQRDVDMSQIQTQNINKEREIYE